MVVVDDALLLALVADRLPSDGEMLAEAARQGEVFTTGCWYWRLARAVARPSPGALSRALATLSDSEQRQARAAIGQLPDEIGLLDLRRLVPLMQVLPGQLNLLTAEAVAAALVLEAPLLVTTDSALLHDAAAEAGVEVTYVRL